MHGASPPLLLLLFLYSLAPQQLGIISYASSTSTVRCHAAERDALMEFKRGLRDPSGRLSSWVGQDCCGWEGIGCSNITGHVVHLDLRKRQGLEYSVECYDESNWVFDEYGCRWALYGNISWSLLSLQHLRHLDLSSNFFQYSPIPEFLGSFRRLTYLNLSAAGFKGKVPDHLGNLSHLHHLDLSYNFHTTSDDYIINGLYIENAGWISQLTSLRVLNVDSVNLRNASNWLQAMNMLPHIQKLLLRNCEIASLPPHNSPFHVNFTSLTTLDLFYNHINSSIPNWLFNITSLEQLYLGGNFLHWPDLASISKLPSLMVLDLSENVFLNGSFKLCKLQSLSLLGIQEELINLEAIFSNSCIALSLEELDMGYTQLNGTLPDWLESMKNIKHLDLSGNSLYGPLPASLVSLLSLQYLDLNSNQLSGTLPDWLATMKNIKHLDLSRNSLYGPLPASLGSLSSLQYLDLSYNNLNGTIAEGMFRRMKGLVTLDIHSNSLSLSESHLANLPATLKHLDISSNTLFLNESHEDWIPPCQLKYLDMSFCKILPKPRLPKWLSTQRLLYSLDLSNAGIKDTFPKWLPTTMNNLDLSNNEITGHVPQYLPKLTSLDLSNNSLSGQLPSAINDTMPIMTWLDLSTNNITGSIPFSICQIKYLEVLRLSKNNFSGRLPNCLESSTKIATSDLSSNNLQGAMSNFTCNMRRLKLLHLSHNVFSGHIPDCLKSCTRLIILDLGNNHLAGNIPTWIGENLLHLQVLNLRSNNFTGDISPRFSNLEYLEVLDLSNNKLSGVLPHSFSNFSAFKVYPIYDDSAHVIYDVRIWLFIKGSKLEYDDTSSYARSIDLSNNGLYGDIPKEMGNLNLLQSLNLSHNYLVGEIPRNIDGMKQLEVLDLSRNNLSGPIPSTLSSLNFLGTLDLSYNNLSGSIPSGSQLQTFDQSSYVGNPNLCGSPLPKNCTNSSTKGSEEVQEEDTNSRTEIVWLFASIALGFITGFWTVCGVLISKRRWRYAFFRAIDNMYDKIYVTIVVNMANKS